MNKDQDLVISNAQAFYAIAQESYILMRDSLQKHRRPNNDGTGYINVLDPKRTSFNNALVCIVFTAIWLESILHLYIMKIHGEKTFREFDYKNYVDKLTLLGLTDQDLLNRAAALQLN